MCTPHYSQVMTRPRRDQIYKVTDVAKLCCCQIVRKCLDAVKSRLNGQREENGKFVCFSIYCLRQMMADITSS